MPTPQRLRGHRASDGAPILAQSLAFLDCELRERVPTGGHTLFIGEIVDCGFLRDEDTPVLHRKTPG